MTKIAILFLSIFCGSMLFAQESEIDSLKNKIAKAGEDSNKVKLYLLAGKAVIYQDPNEAIVYYLKGARLSDKIKYITGSGLCFLSLGNAYSFLSKTDSSLAYMDTALGFLRKINSAQYLGNFFGNRADTYVQISDFKKALQDCDTATKYIEAGGSKVQLAFIYNIRADVYWHLKQYQQNSVYVDKALKIHEETGNTRMVGQAYSDKADWYALNKEFDKAIAYYTKAIHIADSIHDESNLSRYHASLSDTYLEIKKINKAAASALLALKYAQEEANPVQEAFVQTLLCRVYTLQGNPELSIKYGRQGYYMAMQEIDFPLQQSSAAALAKAFKRIGNMDSAYHYLQISKDLNDSLITKNFNRETANLQISFDVSQKEKQIELLAKDSELQQQRLQRQWLLLVSAAIIALLVLVGAWMLVNRNRLKQRMKELELRNQIAADLHDEVGSSLSSIHMLSQMANTNLENPTHKNILDRVSANAKETMDRMSDIVWMIKPGETETGSLKQRMEKFAHEICSGKNIELKMDIAAIENIRPTMGQRKNIYLLFKEALNNAVKYSQTKSISINASLVNKNFILQINDEGKGFDTSKTKRGNGLDNMRNRALESGGELSILSTDEGGTQVRFLLPV